ncbi:hypothetical protein AB6D20_018505 [Vibrio splendidus]|uniref:Uncharacterized protein n=1 Tax=Vibrio splendidus TaxID=29497 RepID=A0A2T5F0Z6_VIBSP|nr:hypothetical protein [Vibrio splendidus]OEF66476.1 hypothetical protein A148_06435 [Vibrio splendidus 1F-157]PTP39424.1 hypothetical protein CWO07_02320 [Vibrio splendidus]PTP66597.1 hypothetical protein CWO23_17760 [Vibrio splendidus]
MSFFNEDWVTLSALVALTVSILPLIKFLHELVSSNKHFKVKRLELLYQSFGEPNNPAMKLMVEQQFCAVFKCSASFEDICVLLSASKTTKAVELYKDSHTYLNCDGEKFTFVEKYREPKNRMKEYVVRPFRNFALYMIAALPAVTLGMVSLYVVLDGTPFKTTFGVVNVIVCFVSAAFCGMLVRVAYYRVTDTHSIKYAEELLTIYDNEYVKSVELKLWDNANKLLKINS